ncbi:MAG TPA: FtsX-like permease family protein [Acidimicrobiia bacterium]|nr:FtsX-like permease family protein [Acidimicrobiia bacterium]
MFAGLGSTATWRRQSNDASFAAVGMHDLRISLSPGTFTNEGALTEVAAGIDDAHAVDGIAERLVVDSQVDATTGDESILVSARIVGMSFDAPDPVDAVWVRDGAAPDPETTAPIAVLEAKFADVHDLPTHGTITMAGGLAVDYVGLGVAPEDFYVSGPEGTIFAQGELATLYVPLPVAQDLTGRPGAVNDAVLRLVDGADRGVVADELARTLDGSGISATVSTRDDAEAYRILYEDIENDQLIWNALAALILGAAALAAFNLVSRIVEAQRREIGIGMALGVPRRRLAIRPLLVGAQVAILGAGLGVVVGLIVGAAMGNLLRSFLPLPVHRTPFQLGVFAQAAILGLAIPIIASALPVWRAVRVEPIEAIRTGHLAAKANRLTDWTNRIRLPGSSLSQMPMRNLLRTPRRALLTALGVGAAITALVAVMGMLDSFTRTIDQGTAELTRGGGDRVIVQLDTFYEVGSPEVAAVVDSDAVGQVDPDLRLPATALAADAAADLDLLVELVDFETSRWTPTVRDAAAAGAEGGVVLSAKAATDLGVGTGDSVQLRHPVRDETGAFTLRESDFVVTGIHANPIRTFAYADVSEADQFGLAGTTNVLQTYAAPDATRADLQRAVFDLPGVTSSQAVARVKEVFDDALEQFIGFLYITAGAVLVLALLIAFNTTRITVDERRREHATMRAFGLPVRTVMGVVVKEATMIGVVATGIGVAAGYLFLGWMLHSLATRTLPDLSIGVYISPSTLLLALAVGIIAVAVAPLFLVRRVRQTSIPDTLRVME